MLGRSTAICARIGLLEARVWAEPLARLRRDTDYGCEMRSRSWLDAADLVALTADRVGADVLAHCHEEMTYLAGFPPGLHAKQTAGVRRATRV